LTKHSNHSVVRTIRLDTELNSYLVDEAKKTNITVSALASQIFTSYRDRYSFVDMLNPVALTQPNFSLFIQKIEEDDLSSIASVVASRVRLYTRHIYGAGRVKDALTWCISELLPASHWYICNRSDEGLMITHQMGAKWTFFLARFLTSLIEEEVGAVPEVKVENDVILLKPPVARQVNVG
jgi:hypothetical protein